MGWAGINSWALGQAHESIPVMTRGWDNAIGQYVKTNSFKQPPRQMTSGSDLNKTAEGPWINLIDSTNIIFDDGAAWVPNHFQTVEIQKLPANYGQITSQANFGFRHWAFPSNVPGQAPSIGELPGPIPNARRPMWNNLPASLYYQRTVNPTQSKLGELANTNSNKYSLSGNPYAGSASLNTTGANETEVLL